MQRNCGGRSVQGWIGHQRPLKRRLMEVKAAVVRELPKSATWFCMCKLWVCGCGACEGPAMRERSHRGDTTNELDGVISILARLYTAIYSGGASIRR